MNTAVYALLLACALFVSARVFYRFHSARSQYKILKKSYPKYLGEVVYSHAGYEANPISGEMCHALHFTYIDEKSDEKKDTIMWLLNDVEFENGTNLEVYTSEDRSRAIAADIHDQIVKEYGQYLVILGTCVLAVIYLSCLLIVRM